MFTGIVLGKSLACRNLPLANAVNLGFYGIGSVVNLESVPFHPNWWRSVLNDQSIVYVLRTGVALLHQTVVLISDKSAIYDSPNLKVSHVLFRVDYLSRARVERIVHNRLYLRFPDRRCGWIDACHVFPSMEGGD